MKKRSYKKTERYLEKYAKRITDFVENKGDVFSDDFVDDALDYIEKVEELKKQTEN